MKRFNIFLSFILFACISVSAQHKINGSYFNKSLYLKARVNLDEKIIPVPGLELDSCYGYLQGNINGSWVFLRIKEKNENRAVVRAISERGADAQDLELTLTPEGDLSVKQLKDNFIKGVEKNKYVKLPKPFVLNRP